MLKRSSGSAFDLAGDQRPLLGVKRKSDFASGRSALDPDRKSRLRFQRQAEFGDRLMFFAL
jgi:hypothetical protein